MTRCTKCIMPESYPGVSINSDGVCSLCQGYRSYHKYLGKEKLWETLRPEKGRGPYDCVVPISGGKDSTFILYYTVKELNLRALALSYDSGFQTDIAKENVKNACETLDVPLVVVKSPGDIQKRILRESLLASARVGYLRDFCGNCEAIIRMISINTAKKYDIPFVLWGSSAFETLSNESYDQYLRIGQRRGNRISAILHAIRTKVAVLLKSPGKIRRLPKKLYPYIGYHAIKYNLYSIAQRRKLRFPWKYALRPHFVPPFSEHSPKFVHFFEYITWDTRKYTRLLADEVKWRHPSGRDTRFDCSIHCFANAQYVEEYGISHDGVNFCQYLREGDITRDDVIARETLIVSEIEAECRAIAERIGLTNYQRKEQKSSKHFSA